MSQEQKGFSKDWPGLDPNAESCLITVPEKHEEVKPVPDPMRG